MAVPGEVGMARKGSYFFVIDAFIAAIVILGGIVVVFAGFFEGSSSTTVFLNAEDTFKVMDGTLVRNYDDPLVRGWIRDGVVNDTSRTLLQQLAYFKVAGDDQNASALAAAIINGLPENVGVEIWLDDVLYASQESVAKEDNEVFFSSKRIVLLRKRPRDTYPPVVVEVQTWQ